MPPPDPLDDVAFLARSAHRVGVLETLMEGSQTRPELHDRTGIPQPTLGRILGDFEDRHWVEQQDRAFTLTAAGELLAAEFDDLLDTIGTVQRLDSVAHLLPTDEMDFDVRQFASATITTPQAGDAFRHVRRAEELLDAAAHVRILADTISSGALENLHDRVVAADTSELHVESVITDDAIKQALADPTLTAWIEDLLASDRTPIYRYDGSIPMTIAVADDVAMLALADEQGIPGALVETTDASIRTWVDDQIDSYRAEATAMTVADLSS